MSDFEDEEEVKAVIDDQQSGSESHQKYARWRDTNIYFTNYDEAHDGYIDEVMLDYLEALIASFKERVKTAKNLSLFKILLPEFTLAIIFRLKSDFNCREYEGDCKRAVKKFLRTICFGDEQIKKIGNLFDFVDSSQLLNEWDSFRVILYLAATNKQKWTFQSWTQSILTNESHQENYPMIVSCFAVLVVSPSTSVNCERGFSLMNLIKTYLLNRLLTEQLNNRMTIASNKKQYGIGWYMDRQNEIAQRFNSIKDRRGPYQKNKKA